MDEYLSKPLKQNHLIQTILKCATLGGALLEKGREVRTNAKDDASSRNTPSTTPTPVATPGPANSSRPPIEPRAYTTTGPIVHGSVESPQANANVQDPLEHVSRSLSYEK